MKKILSTIGLGLLVGLMLMPQPAFAGFTNGGFESGDFTGWTLDYGRRNAGANTVNWSGTGSTNPPAPVSTVIAAGALQPGQTTAINPYYGTYMARINDVYGGYHASRLSQTTTVTQADIDAGAKIFVRWGAALVEPSNPADHQTANFPFFSVTFTIGSVPTTFTADSNDLTGFAKIGNQIGNPTGSDVGDIFYKTDVWEFDISGYAVGTSMTMDLFAADCGLGGHGGFAFIDGIGTEKPAGVPEPGTLILLGCALAGLYGIRRKIS